jgi:hypothetical protein
VHLGVVVKESRGALKSAPQAQEGLGSERRNA